MKNTTIAMIIVSLGLTSLAASDKVKEVISCKNLPSKAWERDKYLINLDDNVIVSCGKHSYIAKTDKWK